jgi:hypothetical protein
MRRILMRQVLFGVSFLLLFEEWLWALTTGALALLSRFAPIASLERWISAQPPRVALVLLGVTLLVADKLVVTALFARVWQLTEPAVTQIDPVRKLRDEFLRLRGMLHAWLDRQPAYVEVRDIVRRHVAGLRRRRDAARRVRQRREAQRHVPADTGASSGVVAGVSRDR